MKTRVNLHEKAAKKARSKILDAAHKLFIQKGFKAASIEEIAKKASINPSLIYHYFKSKEELWREVKIHLINDVQSITATNQPGQTNTLASILEKLVHNRSAIYNENPLLFRMVLWQHLEDNQQKVAGPFQTWEKEWIASIKAAQEAGEITKSLHPEEIFYLLNAVVWAPLLVKSEDSKGFSKRLLSCLTEWLK